MGREQTRRAALNFLMEEQNALYRRQPQEDAELIAASAKCKRFAHARWWQIWQIVNMWAARLELNRIHKDIDQTQAAKRRVGQAIKVLAQGFPPSKEVLNAIQAIANETLMTQVCLAQANTENERINTRCQVAHQLLEELREDYRANYGHAA